MIKINVNEINYEVDVSPDTPLLWVIRDHLNLYGTKYGCGMAQCGACTMHLDGQAIRTCVFPVAAAVGKKVVTIEGLKTAEGKAVQKSWQKNAVVQCGYCQSGQIMSAAALLTQTPNPDDEQIDTFMSGNICRCSTYHRIKGAIKVAANDLASIKVTVNAQSSVQQKEVSNV